jgi:hypothetical protein
VSCSVKGFFEVQEYCSCGHIVVEIQGYMIRKPHTLQGRAVTCTKIKLTCIQQVILVYVLLYYFLVTFSNSLPVVSKKLIGLGFCGNFGSLPGFGGVNILASFQELGK